MEEFLAGGLPNEWLSLVRKSSADDEGVASIENFSEDTNSSQAYDARDLSKKDSSPSKVQQYIDSVWQSENQKGLTNFKNSILEDELTIHHKDLASINPQKATDWLESVDLSIGTTTESFPEHSANKSMQRIKAGSFLAGGYAQQLRTAQNNLTRSSVCDVLHVQVDLVVWCCSVLVTQSILLNENYEGESYCLVFFHCQSDRPIMRGSFVRIQSPFHLVHLEGSDNTVFPVYLAKRYQINKTSLPSKIVSSYDFSSLNNTCHSDLLKSRALLRRLFYEKKLDIVRLLDIAPAEPHTQQMSSSLLNFHRTPTTLLHALEIQNNIADKMIKITFSATIKLSVFENNDHKILKNGIGCYHEAKWVLLLEDKDYTFSKLMIANEHYTKWRELIERGEGLQFVFHNISVLRKENSCRYQNLLPKDFSLEAIDESFSIKTIWYVLETEFDSYWEKRKV
ncbi:PREDICTED: uncharacterized protein LOC109580400 [Amphimedon queenslandica]|uniref:Uncharacterized protein n=1 Tax=Amphimedon queenslandica TaxID=400682 RepID=A0A1X7VVC2_AMPQE|nr:PREDICTED: uncharacterized protein LOC109580400 [Amphimedon queenslandica]|eukprot:XP_019849044.1 PREDICTED: uncharacterized protein LOC109580400 [Amphimedon queenslandica]